MPKLIDHQQRASEIVEAAWRVLVRDGVAAVSVRNVAAEAGIGTASLRRSFPTQSELHVACLELLGERVAARVAALPTDQAALPRAEAALAEVIPLDPRRRTEMEVYLALGTAALSDPTLADAFADLREGFRALCEEIVGSLAPASPHRRREALHLVALVDGLALQVLLGEDPRAAVDVVGAHLTRLASSPSV